MNYGNQPIHLGQFDISLSEVMYYLYLPVKMRRGMEIRMPENVRICLPLIERALGHAINSGRNVYEDYCYLSARKGWATPDNPLNRPGWHCDGFGSDDLNFVWWGGPGTRFAVQPFKDISADHVLSLVQFESQVEEAKIQTYPERGLYAIDSSVVHATPLLSKGCMRQYIKVSLSTHRYNLENNSHNYLFDYAWPLHSRDLIRNDTHKAQLDYV